MRKSQIGLQRGRVHNCNSKVATKTIRDKKKEVCLKLGDTGAILRRLEDAEQRLADVRVNAAADKTRSCTISPQKKPTLDDEQRRQDTRESDEGLVTWKGARSLPIGELDITLVLGKIKSDTTSVNTKT